MCRDEVLKYVKTFTEVCLNRELDGLTGGICHKTTHTCQLLNLLVGTTRTGVSHHVDVVVFIKVVKKLSGNFIISFFPCLDYCFVTVFFCHKTTAIVSCNLINRSFCCCNNLFLTRRHGHIGDRYGHRCAGRILITQRLDCIQSLSCRGCTVCNNTLLKNLLQLLLTYMEVNFKIKELFRSLSLYKSKILADDFVEDETAECRFYVSGYGGAILERNGTTHLNSCVKGNCTVLVCKNCFVYAAEHLTLTEITRLLEGQVVDTENHILGGNGYRTTIRRFQQVVRRQQEEAALCLCFHRKRKMHSHLVTVEVCVERGTYQRMQLDCLTFYQNRLERLNTKTVKRWCTVQHYRMFTDNILKDIPDLRLQLSHHKLCCLDVACNISCSQFLHNKRLEQLDCHLFRKTALINLKFRTNYDNGTTGIVNTLTEKVLTETTLLTL